jgi:hypothetical protein
MPAPYCVQIEYLNFNENYQWLRDVLVVSRSVGTKHFGFDGRPPINFRHRSLYISVVQWEPLRNPGLGRILFSA